MQTVENATVNTIIEVLLQGLNAIAPTFVPNWTSDVTVEWVHREPNSMNYDVTYIQNGEPHVKPISVIWVVETLAEREPELSKRLNVLIDEFAAMEQEELADAIHVAA